MRKYVNPEVKVKRTVCQNICTLWLDWRYGQRLLDDEKVSPYYDRGCFHTQSIEYSELDWIFSHMNYLSNETIMDVGCGRGRLFNFLLHKGFRGNMYGVEIDPEIYQFTYDRLSSYQNVTIVCDNAIFSPDEKIDIYFMFCPFDREHTKAFAKAIEKAHKSCKVIYYHAKYCDEFLQRSGWIGKTEIHYSSSRKANISCCFLQYKK